MHVTIFGSWGAAVQLNPNILRWLGQSSGMLLAWVSLRPVSRIGIAITPAQTRSMGSGVWRYLDVSGRIPPLTRSIGLGLWASRADGTNNNVAFDGVRAFIRTE